MIISSWNIRGYNDPVKHGFVHGHVTQHKVDVLALLETRVRPGKEDSLLRKWRVWNHANNMPMARNGRIWLFWREMVNLTIIKMTSQMIHCEIVMGNATKLQVSFIYASNAVDERLTLWNELRDLSMSIQGPWCLMGDFNVVLNLSEIHNSRGTVLRDRSMNEFEALFKDLSLVDHPATGCFFTWSNRRTQDLQCRKLDRVAINEAWMDLFQLSRVSFEEPGISDHCPIVFTVPDQEDFGPKPFKYFNHWSTYKDFPAVVQEVWSKSVTGSPMYVLNTRLRFLKTSLRKLGNEDRVSIDYLSSRID